MWIGVGLCGLVWVCVDWRGEVPRSAGRRRCVTCGSVVLRAN